MPSPDTTRLPHPDTTRLPPPPRVKGWPIVGSGLELRRDAFGFLARTVASHGEVCAFTAGAQRFLLVNRADLVSRVLKDLGPGYSKTNLMYDELRVLFGTSTFSSEGTRWRHGRQLIEPSIDANAARGYLPVFERHLQRFTKRISEAQKAAGALAPVDFEPLVFRLTLDIFVELTLGSLDEAACDVIATSIEEMLALLAERVTAIVRMPIWMPTPSLRRGAAHLARMDEVIYRVVDRYLATGDDDTTPPLLRHWRRGLERTTYTRREIRDEIVGIFAAAYGTTAVALSWILYHAAARPEAQAKLVEEAAHSRQNVARDALGLQCHTFTAAFVHEALRLTPPAWVISRRAEGNDELGGFDVAAGTMVLISPYQLHRNPRHWQDPLVFRPERFLEKSDRLREATLRCEYIPWSVGKRMCSGRSMALMEIFELTLGILERFELSVPPGYTPRIDAGFSLYIDNGLPLNIRPRA